MDPVVGAAAAKLVGDIGAEGTKTGSGLLTRVLGPSADVIGEALARYTEFRMANVARIVERADKKTSSSARTGSVPPRVAHRLLEGGSYCDDELMAEYLSGVLAGSRTPSGRDDRAIAWSDLVSGMSSLELRAHYLLYREWAALLRGRTDINLGVDTGRKQSVMYVPLDQFAQALVGESAVDPEDALVHSVLGLVRRGLVADTYAYGRKETLVRPNSPYDPFLEVRPSSSGIELFGWSQGRPGLRPRDLGTLDQEFEGTDIAPRLAAVLPSLPDPPDGVSAMESS